jgi:epsilon-lactone hydrolase
VSVAELTGELGQAREAVAGRLRGIDPDDVQALRRAYDAFSASDPLPELAANSEFDLGGVKCLGLLPKGCSGDHVLFWLHGGGFNLGSPASHKAMAAQTAFAAKASTVLPDYRLAPEARHPAALEDCLAAYRGMLNEGVRAENVVIVGDSAGGALAVMLAQRLKAEAGLAPAALALLSPWIDFEHRGWSFEAKASRDPFLTRPGLEQRARAYFGDLGALPAEARLLEADLRGLPPALIQVGEAEVLLSDSTAIAERLGAAGSPVTLEIWPEMFHVFQARFKMLTPAREAIARVGEWARAHFRTRPETG